MAGQPAARGGARQPPVGRADPASTSSTTACVADRRAGVVRLRGPAGDLRSCAPAGAAAWPADVAGARAAGRGRHRAARAGALRRARRGDGARRRRPALAGGRQQRREPAVRRADAGDPDRGRRLAAAHGSPRCWAPGSTGSAARNARCWSGLRPSARSSPSARSRCSARTRGRRRILVRSLQRDRLVRRGSQPGARSSSPRPSPGDRLLADQQGAARRLAPPAWPTGSASRMLPTTPCSELDVRRHHAATCSRPAASPARSARSTSLADLTDRAATALIRDGGEALHRKDLPAAIALLERGREILPKGARSTGGSPS